MNGQCVLSGCLSDADCAGNPSGPYCDVTVGSPKLNQCTACKVTNNDPATTDNPNSLDCPSNNNPNNPVGQDLGILGKCYTNGPPADNQFGYCDWATYCAGNNECGGDRCSKRLCYNLFKCLWL